MVLFPPKLMINAMTSILDGDVPSYGVYIAQFTSFARVCSHVEDFNALIINV